MSGLKQLHLVRVHVTDFVDHRIEGGLGVVLWIFFVSNDVVNHLESVFVFDEAKIRCIHML